jgi:hypothetical protein
MKTTTLYVMYCEDSHGEYELWFDENNKCVGGYFCDDANWRSEYFNGIFESVGIEIETLKYDKKTADKARKEQFGS